MAHASCAVTKDQIWSASENLSPRVKRLRDEYFNFNGRPYFQNEVMPFTTGTEWDDVFPYHHFAVVPDVYPFMPSFADSLLACARKVEVPEGFFAMSLEKRRATFLKIVVEKYLPVQILDGELIVGGQFNTALTRSHSEAEARKAKKLHDKWWKRAKRANELGLGNSGVTPGHLIPNYKKVLQKGFRGLTESYKAEIAGTNDHAKIDYLEAMIIAAEVPRILSLRYAEAAEKGAEQRPTGRAGKNSSR